MLSKINLSKSALMHNIQSIKSHVAGDLCVMVKANAYGHGAKEIVGAISPNVKAFGVSNDAEAFEIREETDKEIIVFGLCDSYERCIKNNISVAVFSFEHLKNLIDLAKSMDRNVKLHLCVNSGMNRYGIKKIKEFKKIIKYLKSENIQLQGLYTHFSSLTTDEAYTKKQWDIFQDYVALLPDEWKTIVHIGGSKSIYRKGFVADMYRTGIEVYGYGGEGLKPVLSILSRVVDIQDVEKGEHVGYLCGFTAERKMRVATIPVGYADGLSRRYSNKLFVKINDKLCRNVGNICMDAFMVDVSHDKKCKIGDKVAIEVNARQLATHLCSTEYEVLTAFCSFRGERRINL